MAGVFISYRRDDTAGHAGRLFDHLSRTFGEDGIILGALEKGMPVIVAAHATESWGSDPSNRTGLIKPAGDTDRPLGATVITIVGYEPDTRRFKFANNWGTTWGDRGFGYFDSADASAILLLNSRLWAVMVPPPEPSR